MSHRWNVALVRCEAVLMFISDNSVCSVHSRGVKGSFHNKTLLVESAFQNFTCIALLKKLQNDRTTSDRVTK